MVFCNVIKSPNSKRFVWAEWGYGIQEFNSENKNLIYNLVSAIFFFWLLVSLFIFLLISKTVHLLHYNCIIAQMLSLLSKNSSRPSNNLGQSKQ